MDVSNYQRRESGEKSISMDEWHKLAEFLEVPVSDIYESDDQQTFIIKENTQASGNINS